MSWRVVLACLVAMSCVGCCLGQGVPTLPPEFQPLPPCEFHTDENEGVLSLLHYHTMTNCTWTVSASAHHIIRLNLRYALRLTTMDTIVLYDGPTILSKVLYTFHQLSPDPDEFQHEIIATTGSFLTLQLAAMGPRDSGSGYGFVGMYTAVPTCPRGDEVLTSPGTIQSPLILILKPVLRLSYIKDAECTWKIRAPEGMRIRVDIERFDLEDSPQCHNDYLVFMNYRPSPGLPWDFYKYAAPPPEAPTSNLPMMSRYCGTPLSLINSSALSAGNTMGIVFHSDYLVERAGFTLTYDFVPGCEEGMFECHSDNRCLSPHKHCDGVSDCADGSDEESCLCSVATQFTCTANMSECVPRSQVCGNTTLCSDGSDAVACDDDVCIGRELPLFNLNRTVVAVAPPSWMRTCLSSIPLGKGEQAFTLEILKNSLVNMYSYSDLARDSSKAANPQSKLDNGYTFDQYNISVNLAGSLEDMKSVPYTNMLSFHTDLMALFNRLKDAHTTYEAPFSPLRAYLPVWFNTKIIPGSSRQIVVVSEVDGRLARLHENIYGTTTDSLWSLEGEEVTMINEQPAMAVLRGWVESWPDYKSISVRLNSLMSTRSLDMTRHPLPTSDTIQLAFANRTTVTLHYLVTYPMTDPDIVDSTFRVPNLRRQFDHRADYEGFFPVYDHILKSERIPLTGEGRRRRSIPDLVHEASLRIQQRLDASRNVHTSKQSRPASAAENRYTGTARADHEVTHNSLLTSKSGDIHAFQIDDAVVFKMSSFSDPEAVDLLYAIADHAKRHRLHKLLFDLSGNTGGYVKQQYEMVRFLVPHWYTLNFLCDPFDFKSATFWDLLSNALNNVHDSIPNELSYTEAAYLAQRIANLSSYASYTYRTPLVTDIEALIHNASISQSASPAQRSIFLRSVLDDLLSPTSTFHKMHPDILLLDVKNADALGGSFNPKRAYYDVPVTHTRGGVTSGYTQPFYLTECESVALANSPPTSPFHSIYIITDGRCASACSQFVTKLQLGKEAQVITFGGFANEAIDASSVAGGQVQRWNDFWTQYSIDLELASLTSSSRAIGEAYFANFSFPLPLTSRALPTFNFFEYYSAKLGGSALPREWYLIPPDIHLPSWPGDLHRYPQSRLSNPDSSWLGDAYHRQTVDSLARMYRRTLAAVAGKYPASDILTPPPPIRPCSYVGPCQNSSANVSVRTTVEFIQVDTISANLRVYDEHTCDDMRLVLYVVGICNATDNGPRPDGGARDARQMLVIPMRYYVTPWSDEWTQVLTKVCPCTTWKTRVTAEINEASCPQSRCKVSFIRYDKLRGFWLAQGLRSLYLSNVAGEGTQAPPKLQPEFFYTINADPRNCPAVVLFKPFFPNIYVDFTELPKPLSTTRTAEIMAYVSKHYERAANLNCIYVHSQPAGKFDDGSGASLYRPNVQCAWVIAVDGGFNVKLAISHELEGNASLAHIDIRSDYTPNAPLVQQVYKPGLHFTELTVPSAKVLITFTTSPFSQGGTGFSVQYSAVKRCGGTLVGTEGSLASPTVNETGLYSNNVACTWTIQVPEGYRIQIEFSEFDLDVALERCDHDIVKLIDPEFPDNHKELCGPFIPPVWSSIRTQARVEFTTDYVDQHRGFRASWTAVPNPGNKYEISPQSCEVLTDQSGTVSMRWSNEFPLQVYDCNHTIRAPQGNRVRIFFTSFLLNCRGGTLPLGCAELANINLTILNGNDPNPGAILTGNTMPQPFVSTDSTVVVRFRAVPSNYKLFQYQGTHYTFQFTVCEACSPGQMDLGPCSGIFPTLCSSGFNEAPTTVAPPIVNPTDASHFKLSHGAIAGIICGVISLTFIVALVLMLRVTKRSRSDSNLSASLSSSAHHLFRRSNSRQNRKPLLTDEERE